MGIETLRRPWRRKSGRNAPDDNTVGTVDTLSRRNYKVYADLGCTTSIMVRQPSILNTGAGSNFVRAETIPDGSERWIEPGEISTIAYGDGRLLRTRGAVSLTV